METDHSHLNPTTKVATTNNVMLTPSTAGPRSDLECVVELCQLVPGKLAPHSWRSTIEEVGDAGAVDDALSGAPDVDEDC